MNIYTSMLKDIKFTVNANLEYNLVLSIYLQICNDVYKRGGNSTACCYYYCSPNLGDTIKERHRPMRLWLKHYFQYNGCHLSYLPFLKDAYTDVLSVSEITSILLFFYFILADTFL